MERESHCKGHHCHFDDITWSAYDRPLLPVTNRGTIYEPPREHLGASIEHLLGKGKAAPIVVADLALHFYVSLINRVLAEVRTMPQRCLTLRSSCLPSASIVSPSASKLSLFKINNHRQLWVAMYSTQLCIEANFYWSKRLN